jgi:TonB family protein
MIATGDEEGAVFRWAVAAATFWLASSAAWAQTPNPVIQHYRAYQAALDANDFVTAEREAAAALAASEERDGDGGRTAVLALNVAVVRFNHDDPSGALAPGRRALALAQAQGEQTSGVSPVQAQLLLSRAELASGQAGAQVRLQTALEAARQAALPDDEIYEAAIQFGEWLLTHDRAEDAQAPFALALGRVHGDDPQADYARFKARLNLGRALMLSSQIREELRDGPELGTRIVAAPDLGPEQGALDNFDAAIDIMAPHSYQPADDRSLTRAQSALAQAIAWRAALRARMISLNMPTQDYEPRSWVWSLNGSPCNLRLVMEPEPRYPRQALNREHVGAAVVHVVTNASGETTSATVAASVGGQVFIDAVSSVASQWRMVPRGPMPGNCDKETVWLIPIVFAIR